MRRAQQLFLGAVSAILIARALPAAGQPRLPPQAVAPERIDRLERWLEAVDTHVPGEEDEALAEVDSWSNAELGYLWMDVDLLMQIVRSPKLIIFSVRVGGAGRPTQVFYTSVQLQRMRSMACAVGGALDEVRCTSIQASRGLPPALIRMGEHAKAVRQSGDVNYVMRRGALLHTDAAIRAHDFPPEADPTAPQRAAEPAPPQAGPRQFRLHMLDGQPLDFNQVPVHWEMSRMLLDFVVPRGQEKPVPGRDDMVRDWYRATASWMQANEDHDADHLDRAREIFPTDPVILFLSGAQHEIYAGQGMQVAMRGTSLPAGARFLVGSDKSELRRAEGFFRGALSARPDFDEARLHLGRVAGLLGRHEEAAGELRRVAPFADERLTYYRDLFLGVEEEALGRFDAAREAYERASEIAPLAQSPWLALTELARRRGDRSAALRALQHLFELPVSEADQSDPWWSYGVMQARDAEGLLDDLRAPFVVGGAR